MTQVILLPNGFCIDAYPNIISGQAYKVDYVDLIHILPVCATNKHCFNNKNTTVRATYFKTNGLTDCNTFFFCLICLRCLHRNNVSTFKIRDHIDMTQNKPTVVLKNKVYTFMSSLDQTLISSFNLCARPIKLFTIKESYPTWHPYEE